MQARELDRVKSAYTRAVVEVHKLRDQTHQDQTSIRQPGEQVAQLRELQNLNTAIPTSAAAAATETLLRAQRNLDNKTRQLADLQETLRVTNNELVTEQNNHQATRATLLTTQNNPTQQLKI